MTRRGLAPVSVAHVGDHPAVLGEVVARVEDVVLAVVDVLDRDVDAREVLAHRVARLHAVQPAAVGVAAPGLVDGGEVGVVVPVAGLEQRAAPRRRCPAWRRRCAWSRAATPRPRRARPRAGRVGQRVLAHVVALGRLVEPGDQRHRVVEQRHQVREGVAEEARDAHGDVDPRPAELLQRDRLEPDHPPRLGVPRRAARRAARGSRRRRRRGCASRPCPTPRSRPSRDARRRRRGGARAARRPAAARPRRRGRWAAPWGRPSRSCARSAGRRRARASATPTARRGRGGRAGRRAGGRARRSRRAGAARPRRRRSAARVTTPASSWPSTSAQVAAAASGA